MKEKKWGREKERHELVMVMTKNNSWAKCIRRTSGRGSAYFYCFLGKVKSRKGKMDDQNFLGIYCS